MKRVQTLLLRQHQAGSRQWLAQPSQSAPPSKSLLRRAGAGAGAEAPGAPENAMASASTPMDDGGSSRVGGVGSNHRHDPTSTTYVSRRGHAHRTSRRITPPSSGYSFASTFSPSPVFLRQRSRSYASSFSNPTPPPPAAAPSGTAGAATEPTPAGTVTVKRTGLYDLHVRHGGQMVPFAGYAMPVQYTDLSIGASHRWTRERASLFDVGHMVQHRMTGPGAEAFLSAVTPSSLAGLAPDHSTLSCLLHPGTGGIVDDTVITRMGPQDFYIVTNAACREKDLAFLAAQAADHGFEIRGNSAGGASAADDASGNARSLDWTVLEGQGLVALQGPKAVQVLQAALADSAAIDLQTLYFGQCAEVTIKLNGGGQDATSPPLLVSRGGYTGEDGFEISIPAEATVPVVEALLAVGGPDTLRLAGLGARDSLRLEAGMCLYGHDLDDTTTPVEAGLSWVVGKDRRESGGFNGAAVILQQLKAKKEGGGVDRRRVGLIVDGAPAREGALILTAQDEAVGAVTSGCPSPTLQKNIAMAYVRSGFHKAGTDLRVVVRGKPRKAQVVKMPFVPSRYFKMSGTKAPA